MQLLTSQLLAAVLGPLAAVWQLSRCAWRQSGRSMTPAYPDVGGRAPKGGTAYDIVVSTQMLVEQFSTTFCRSYTDTFRRFADRRAPLLILSAGIAIGLLSAHLQRLQQRSLRRPQRPPNHLHVHEEVGDLPNSALTVAIGVLDSATLGPSLRAPYSIFPRLRQASKQVCLTGTPGKVLRSPSGVSCHKSALTSTTRRATAGARNSLIISCALTRHQLDSHAVRGCTQTLDVHCPSIVGMLRNSCRVL